MANNTYRIDLLAAGSSTVTVTDDGTGTDWLVIQGSYADSTDIRLNYFNSSPSTGASGQFFTSNPNTTHTLIVNGLIENVRGCDSADYIAGNELDNLLYGDQNNGLGGNDTLSGGDGNDGLYGGIGSDSLTAGAGNDRLFGGDGSDTLSGSAGADTVEGGAGGDSLSGGAELGDTVSYAASAAAVTIKITHGEVTAGLGGDAAGDQISGFRNVIGSAWGDTITDTVAGTIAFGYNDNRFDGGGGADKLVMGGGNDTAIGGAGNDSLSGDGGKDRLIGGAGADALSGGGAADRFIYSFQSDSTATAAGRDTISDFRHAQADRIDLSALDANLLTAGVNDSFTFRTAAQGFSGNGGEVTYVAVSGGIKVMADTDANGTADFAVVLQGITAVVAGDFVL